MQVGVHVLDGLLSLETILMTGVEDATINGKFKDSDLENTLSTDFAFRLGL